MKSLERLAFQASGISLAADAVGRVGAPTILFLHGGGQTRQSWHRALAEAEDRGYRAIALDMRGHGESGWASDGKYGLDRFTSDARQVLDQIGGEPVLVGASLGGLVGMLIAAKPPPPLRALVLVDVTPRIERSGAMEIMAFMGSAPDGFSSLEEAADAVAAYLPHRPRPQDTSGLQRNLRLRDGRYYWHWDPAFMQVGKEPGGDAQFHEPNPLAGMAREITIPTLLIRGGRSRIVSDEGAREFLELVPHAEFVDIAGAHHMVAGDDNDAFNDAVFRFVARQFESRPLPLPQG
jgi:pimeloyl-ACP methyl ester carboxylesterase